MDFFQFAGYAEYFVDFSYNDNSPANMLWVCLLVGATCFLIVYVFQVFGLLTIANREGFDRKWMIFIPFLNTYYLAVVSEKNKVYSMKAKNFAIITIVVEAVLVILYIFYYVSAFMCWDYITWTNYYDLYYVINETPLESMPESLNWLWWIFYYGDMYIISWLRVGYIILKFLLLTAFFRTYAAPRYLLFSIVGALLPLTGILVFAVKNNKAMSYTEYIERMRERNYRMYQQQNPYNNNPYNNNPYNNINRPSNNDPGGAGGSSSSGADPFDEFGGSSGGSGNASSGDDSPFEDF